MDAESFRLLRGIVERQLQRLKSVLSETPKDQRGGTYVVFVEQHLAALAARAEATAAAFEVAGAQAREVHGRKLTRYSYLLDVLCGEVFVYQNDVGRSDVPSGLLYLVDYLIEDILKASADPVIHLERANMYSTERLIDRWESLSNELGVVWNEPVEPVIFYLPGFDYQNALLSPILAHEVGHSVILP